MGASLLGSLRERGLSDWFDDQIIAMDPRGMTAGEIQGFFAEQFGIEVSAEYISSLTDETRAEVTARHSCPLEPMYPVIFVDALRVKSNRVAKAACAVWPRPHVPLLDRAPGLRRRDQPVLVQAQRHAEARWNAAALML